MKYTATSHRDADILCKHKYKKDFDEITAVLKSITDVDIKKKYTALKRNKKSMKSLSVAINTLIKERLIVKGWTDEPLIFTDHDYAPTSKTKKTWRLDFTKNDICIEVGFNHGGQIAHNMIKPVLSSNLNHVNKQNPTNIGILITADKELKDKGNFDGAVGPYEKYVEYLKPYSNIITCPLMIIGLKAPKSFYINKKTKRIVNIK